MVSLPKEGIPMVGRKNYEINNLNGFKYLTPVFNSFFLCCEKVEGAICCAKIPQKLMGNIRAVSDPREGLSRVIPGTPNNGTSLWQTSHTIPISLRILMGVVWE